MQLAPLTFPQKYPYETPKATCDFANILGDYTIQGFSVEVSVLSGSDSDPDAILMGDPIQSGTLVQQQLQDGVPGVRYVIAYKISDSNNQQWVQPVYLPVGDPIN